MAAPRLLGQRWREPKQTWEGMDPVGTVVEEVRLEPADYAETDPLVQAIRQLKASGFLPEDTPEITLPECRRQEKQRERERRRQTGERAPRGGAMDSGTVSILSSLPVNQADHIERVLYSD